MKLKHNEILTSSIRQDVRDALFRHRSIGAMNDDRRHMLYRPRNYDIDTRHFVSRRLRSHYSKQAIANTDL